MVMRASRITTVGIVGVVILIGLLGYIFVTQERQQMNSSQFATTTTDSVITTDNDRTTGAPEPVHTPEGWKVYQNSDWGIAFAYPSDWELKEGYHPDKPEILYNLTLEHGCKRETGRICAYDISISQGSRGLGYVERIEPPYVIDGEVSKTWQGARREPFNDGYEQVISVRESEFVFHIYTPDKTKELSDKILSTVTLRD